MKSSFRSCSFRFWYRTLKPISDINLTISDALRSGNSDRLGLFKVAESGLCEYEISLVRVVLDRPAQHNDARFEAENIGPFHQALLVLVLVQQVVPQIVLR